MDHENADFSFSDESSEAALLLSKPEIQNAVGRVIEKSGYAPMSALHMGACMPTDNPYVQRVYILMVYDHVRVPLPHEFMIWVDDYELVFTVVDDRFFDQRDGGA
jgi:hypothetical protein